MGRAIAPVRGVSRDSPRDSRADHAGGGLWDRGELDLANLRCVRDRQTIDGLPADEDPARRGRLRPRDEKALPESLQSLPEARKERMGLNDVEAGLPRHSGRLGCLFMDLPADEL
jgi:hypothetical protein